MAEAMRAERADPQSLEAVTISALTLYLARRYDLAEQFCRQALQADPSFTWAHVTLGRALRAAGRVTEAIPVLERARDLEPGLSETMAALGDAYAQAGRTRPTARRAAYRTQ